MSRPVGKVTVTEHAVGGDSWNDASTVPSGQDVVDRQQGVGPDSEKDTDPRSGEDPDAARGRCAQDSASET